MFRLLIGLVLGAVLMAATAGCGKSEADATSGSTRPKRLRLGWSPSSEEPDRRVRFDGLTAHLSKRLNMPVELVETGSYSAQIEAFRARKIEVGSLSPFAYIIASERTKNVEPLVARGYATGEKSSYRSVLIVPPDSPIHTIEDVKANASKMTLAWVDPASASGHLLPRAYLESIGMNPEKDFKNVIFTLQHLTTAMNIKAGKVDIAASMNTGLQRLVEKGRITKDDYRIIWESEPIINDTTAVRSDLPDDFKEEIRQAYLDFPKESPEIWSKFKALFPEPSMVWVPAQDSDFDELRRIARSVKHMQLLETQ